jgi:hypothetical protein
MPRTPRNPTPKPAGKSMARTPISLSDTPTHSMVNFALQSFDAARAAVISGETLPRMIYAKSRSGKTLALCVPNEGEESERCLLMTLKVMFVAEDICAYAMISEIWVSQGLAHSRAVGSMPSEDPERTEAIMVLSVVDETLESGARQRRTSRGSAPITREPTAVGALEWVHDGVDGAKIKGRFVDLMPPIELALTDKARTLAAEFIARQLGGL